MDKKEYLEKRKALLDEASSLIDEGKIDESEAKMTEVTDLDETYDKAALARTNLEATKDKVKVEKLENMDNKVNGEVIAEAISEEDQVKYEDVFSKVALKMDLDDKEIALFNRMNPENVYTHTTLNTEIVIPKTVISGIIGLEKELHPILNDVPTTYIKGRVSYIKHESVDEGDADYYDEATEVADEKNTFGELVLDGKELAKAVTVTWKLQAMAYEDFIPFIQRELAERTGAAKARAFISGSGDTKYPEGIITALKAESGTPQIVTSSDADISYADLTALMAKVKTGSKSAFYATKGIIWGKLANMLDGQGRPIFIPDVTAGGVGRLFGIPVYQEDAAPENGLILADMQRGYKENVQENYKLVTEQHAKARKTDFVAYQVHDAGVYDSKYLGLLELTIGG